VQQISALLPGMPRTFAAWPVWRDSTTQEVKYQPTPKRQAVRLYHKARRFERQTRQPGRQDGALGRNGLAVLHALLFDFLNYASGRLEPAYARIADRACISPRSVARGLVRLRSAGVLHWLRRCREDRDEEGRFRLRQESNAYAVLPSSQWRGYIEPDPPPLTPWQLGAVPPLPDALEAAAASLAEGGSIEAAIATLSEGDRLGAALARLGRSITGLPA
jgi:hypothetical protein